jgi:hypothetical protein
MKKIFLPALFVLVICFPAFSQKSSFIFLGDIHYDLPGDHDMEWLKSKPDDVRQVKEYTLYTEKYWKDFVTILKDQVTRNKPEIKAIVQAGDISEGLAGNPVKARQMASDIVKAVEDAKTGVPWIISKGNHDITGPGAVDAFNEFYVPMFSRQTGDNEITNASYSYKFDNVQITCVDPWDKNVDMISFLDKELSSSTAKYKFVVIHEPVIPVTERCWHTLRNDPERREKLLEVIAKNKAIVLCAHLHRYAVVARKTAYGPIVQVMAVSVVRDRDYLSPATVITKYGPSIAETVPEWEPATLEKRKKILAEEAKYITFYKQTDLPGYGIIRIDEKTGTVGLDYYAAFGKEPYDHIDLTELADKAR